MQVLPEFGVHAVGHVHELVHACTPHASPFGQGRAEPGAHAPWPVHVP